MSEGQSMLESLELICGDSHWSWKQQEQIIEVLEKATYENYDQWKVKEISYESKQEIKVQEKQTRRILRVFGRPHLRFPTKHSLS